MTHEQSKSRIPRPADGVERRRAVVIGIDHYLPPTPGLSFCAADAIRMAEVLQARGFEVTALHDGPVEAILPTRAAVLGALDAVAAASDADDLVIVYVSSHGTRIERRPHLMLADTPASAREIAEQGLALSELLDRLRGRARWVAIFLDVCRMGLGLDPTIGRAAVHSAEGDGGFALLAGSTSGQIAQDTASGGIFSKCLIEGLAGGAADPDGGLRFSALARYVQAGVARWRKSDEGALKMSSQRPVLRLEVADLQLFPARDHVDLAPRHPAAITCAAFSPDGRRLVTGSEDGAVRSWDPRTGAQVLENVRHGSPIRAVAVSPQDYVSSGSDDGVIKSCRLANGLPDGPDSRFDGTIHALEFTDGGFTRLVGASDGLRYQQLGHIVSSVDDKPDNLDEGGVRAIALWAGGFVTGGVRGEVQRWADELVLVDTRRGPVSAVAVSPDGAYVVGGGGDDRRDESDEPRIRDLERETSVSLVGHPLGVTAISYAPDGTQIATSSRDGIVRLFEAPSGQLRRKITIEVDSGAGQPAANVVAFAPDGGALFVGYADGRGRLFKLSPPSLAPR